MGAFVKVLVEGPGLYILVGNGAVKSDEKMSEGTSMLL